MDEWFAEQKRRKATLAAGCSKLRSTSPSLINVIINKPENHEEDVLYERFDMEGVTETKNLSVTKGSSRDACTSTNVIIIMVIIIIRLNPSLNKNYFNYIDQHRLLVCLNAKVVIIDVDHIIISLNHVSTVKCVKSFNNVNSANYVNT